MVDAHWEQAGQLGDCGQLWLWEAEWRRLVVRGLTHPAPVSVSRGISPSSGVRELRMLALLTRWVVTTEGVLMATCWAQIVEMVTARVSPLLGTVYYGGDVGARTSMSSSATSLGLENQTTMVRRPGPGDPVEAGELVPACPTTWVSSMVRWGRTSPFGTGGLGLLPHRPS